MIIKVKTIILILSGHLWIGTNNGTYSLGKGVQDIKYLCDRCKKQVSEDDSLWQVREGSYCRTCFGIKRRRPGS